MQNFSFCGAGCFFWLKKTTIFRYFLENEEGQPVGTRRHPRVTSLFRSSLPTRRQPRTKKILVTNIKWNDGCTQNWFITKGLNLEV